MQHLVPAPAATAARGHDGLPPAVTSADPRSFAWEVIHRRHPKLITLVQAAHPYSPTQHAALGQLVTEIEDGTIREPDLDAHDGAAWRDWAVGQVGRRWDEVAFLWSESYFYRRLLEAVGFFIPGPWFWLDPFAQQKNAELADPELVTELEALNRLADLGRTERRTALLLAALWGNRADLGFAAQTALSNPEIDENLVVDDTADLWDTLDERDGTICLVADNAGRELLADLMLVDELLTDYPSLGVDIHVKPSPYYVSDATTADVACCLNRLASAGAYAAQAAHRLRERFATGRARLRTHWFYTAPLEFDRMPPDLAATFEAAALTILKGDLNYRRVFGDRHWPATTPAAVAGSYFPTPFAVLRTVKSDVAVGVPADRLARLDDEDPRWRVSGTRALVQLVP